jgi:hypothetical protein
MIKFISLLIGLSAICFSLYYYGTILLSKFITNRKSDGDMELRWVRRFTGYGTQLVLQQRVNTNIPLGIESCMGFALWQDIPIVGEPSNNLGEKNAEN